MFLFIMEELNDCKSTIITPATVFTPSDVGKLLSLFAKIPNDSRENTVKVRMQEIQYCCLVV